MFHQAVIFLRDPAVRIDVPRTAFLDAFQEIFHAGPDGDGDVGFEMQFGDAVRFQALGKHAAQEATGVFECSEGFSGVAPSDYADADLGLSFVGRGDHLAYIYVQDARVRHFIRNQFRQFLSKRFGEALFPMGVHFFNPTTPRWRQPGSVRRNRRRRVRRLAAPVRRDCGRATR